MTLSQIIRSKNNYIEDKRNNFFGLTNIIKSIFGKVYEKNIIGIEIGYIEGKLDSFEIEHQFLNINNDQSDNKTKNNTEDKSPTISENTTIIIDDDDCDDLKLAYLFNNKTPSNVRFKQISNKNKKYFRKIVINNVQYATHILEEGVNVLIINRDNSNYTKEYEYHFQTNLYYNQSDLFSELISNTDVNKMIIVTAIGKWNSLISIRFIETIKNIGGPDLTYFSIIDNVDDNHPFLLVGRKDLCQDNGVFYIKNGKNNTPLTKTFIIEDNISFPSLNHEQNIILFKGLIDISAKLDISNDSRYIYNAPTISKVSYKTNNVKAITIDGYNLQNIKSIYIGDNKGNQCSNIKSLGPNLVTCEINKTIPPNNYSIIVENRNGLTSPIKACPILKLENLLNYRTIKIKDNDSFFQNPYIIDNGVPVYDNLLFNTQYVFHRTKHLK